MGPPRDCDYHLGVLCQPSVDSFLTINSPMSAQTTIDVDLLKRHDQSQLLAFWDDLNETSREKLLSQLENIDFDLMSTLLRKEDESPDFGAMAMRAELPPAVASDGSGAAWTVEQARHRGEAALRAGEVATVLVAGGQGTRLGFDQPKGMFPIGPVSGRTLFQIFADRLKATQQRYGQRVPLFLMTSAATDAATRDYFESNEFLGLDPDQVTIFQQGTMPAVDAETGKILMQSPDAIALSPDGHGGTLRALDRNGCLQQMIESGAKYLFYFQVDNPLVTLCDPVFIGHHILAESELTTQVIRKRYPTEKVGNVVQVDGRTRVIEYSDLPDTAAELTEPDGSLKLWAGSIAVHMFDVAFLDRMKTDASALPFHRASKKVPHVDAAGEIQKPTSPNAIKFEQFIFDLLPAADRTLICEVEPAEAFAPVKNAPGAATDTAELAQAAMRDLHARWVIESGGCVEEGVCVEIHPRAALDAAQFADRFGGNVTITKDRFFDS